MDVYRVIEVMKTGSEVLVERSNIEFLLLHLFPILCGVDVSYETPPSRPVLRFLL